MDLLCCPPDVNPWTPRYDIDSDRIITRIEGNCIILDAPLTCAIEAQYGGGTIRKYTWSGRINNVGIEDIRGVSDFDPSVTSTTGASPPYYADEAHGWTFIALDTVENAWVRRVTAQHFGYSCVQLERRNAHDHRARLQLRWIRFPSLPAAGAMHSCWTTPSSAWCKTATRAKTVTSSSRNPSPPGRTFSWTGSATPPTSDAGPHHRWGTGAIWDNVHRQR